MVTTTQTVTSKAAIARASVDTYRILDTLIKYLRENIPDPLNKGRTWIWVGLPRDDATYPRIGVTHVGGDIGDRFISDEERIYDYIFEIDVFCSTNTGTIDGISGSGNLLLEILGSKVIRLMNGARVKLNPHLFINIDAPGNMITTYPFIEQLQQYRKTIRVMIRVDIPTGKLLLE